MIARFARGKEPQELLAYLALLVGRAYERLDERDKAAPWLERALRTPARTDTADNPRPLPVIAGLPAPTASLRRAARAGDWAGAQAMAADLQRRFQGSADIAALAGDVALGQGNPGRALEHYAMAVRVQRSWPLTRKAIAAYCQIGEDAAADELLRRYVAGDPQNIDAPVMLARRYAALRDPRRAAVLRDHAKALGGGHDPAMWALNSAIAAE
ncbi:MAG: tetratricopeptide repeat protein [Erythrobacter sp.]